MLNWLFNCCFIYEIILPAGSILQPKGMFKIQGGIYDRPFFRKLRLHVKNYDSSKVGKIEE